MTPVSSTSLNSRLGQLHDRILSTIPVIDRIACVAYDADTDMLKTFINSTRVGTPIAGYEFKLSESRSLTALSVSREIRVIDDIPAVIPPTSKHSAWLIQQGYRSSFTVPLFHQDQLLGFLFFNSTLPNAFTPAVQRDLLVFANLINMSLSNELSVIRSITASVHVARDFANLRDFETGAHLERMSRNSRIIAKALAAELKLSDEYVEHVYLFAPLHDIGKIGISDKILLKPGPLDPEERKIMQSHVEKGVQIIQRILTDFDLHELPDSEVMLNIVSCHHEFMDGSGYPRGLKGQEIPLEARIVTVADILDALASPRPYKKGWSLDAAIEELKRMAATGKLDPMCVNAIEQERDQIKDVLLAHQDQEIQ